MPPQTAEPLHTHLHRVQEWAHSPTNAGYGHFESLYLLGRPNTWPFVVSLCRYEATKVEFSSALIRLGTNCRLKSVTSFRWVSVLAEHICQRC